MKVRKKIAAIEIILFLQFLTIQFDVFGLTGVVYRFVLFSKYTGAIALFLYARSRKVKVDHISECKLYESSFIGYFIILVMVQLFTIAHSPIFHAYGFSYITRSAAGFLDRICFLLEVVSICQLVGTEAIKCLTDVSIFDGVIVTVITIARCGLANTMKTFLVPIGVLSENNATTMLEVHELTYVLGILLIYYLFHEKDLRQYRLKILIMILLFWLGNKRIGFAAVFIAALFVLFVRKRGLSRKMLFLTGICGVVICLGYIALLYDNRFFEIMSAYGINLMGRNSIYGFFLRRTHFSPSYMGWGLSATSKAMEHMTYAELGNLVVARGVHNDLLKIYVEFGFLGYILWLIFFMIDLPLNLFRKFGKKTTTLYMALIIYAFITYATDNTEGYPVFQVALFMIPLAASLTEKERIQYGK